MALKLSNNTSSTLAAGITAGDVSMSVAAGAGVAFPTVTAPDIMYITLVRASSGAVEIVKCTSHTVGSDVFTIVRAQDGTTAMAFAAGDKVSVRMCRAAFEAVARLNWRGTYAGGTAYSVNDAVAYLGSSYVNIQNVQAGTGHLPTDAAYWDVLASQGTPGGSSITVSTNQRVLGRFTAGSGSQEELTLHSNLTMSAGGELNVGANIPKKDTAGVFTKTQSITPVALTSSANHIATTAGNSNIFTHTMTEDTTLDAPSGLVAGTTYIWAFTQHASAAKTLAFNAVFLFPGGADGVISTAASAKDILSCVCVDGTNLMCTYSKGYA